MTRTFDRIHLPRGKWIWRIRSGEPERCAVFGFTLLLLAGCAPVPSPKGLVGTWRAQSVCGTDILELDPDSTYTQRVLKPNDNVDVHEGRWTVEPPDGRLSGADLVLHGPIHFCEFDKQKTSDELHLEVNWEWGRTVLLWNPDEPGYEKMR